MEHVQWVPPALDLLEPGVAAFVVDRRPGHAGPVPLRVGQVDVGVVDGRQPLANEDGTIWAAQNGELYNYPRVKPELLRRGHRLQTHTDTEILVHLYEDFGTRLPEHIDGMFAIAVWDTVNKRGLLARDRMGKKPLYYYRENDALYFASEIKSLLRVPGFERRINLEALHHYLSFKHIPCPLSIFEKYRRAPSVRRAGNRSTPVSPGKMESDAVT